MPVDGGHQDRAGAIGRAHLVDVGAAVDQRERGVGVTVTRGEQERRQPTLCAHQIRIAQWFGLVAGVVVGGGPRATRCRAGDGRQTRGGAFGGPLLLDRGDPGVAGAALGGVFAIAGADVDHLGGDGHVGAARGQAFDRLGAAVAGGEHQRGLSPLRLARIRIGAGVEEQRNGGDVARGGGKVQRHRAGGGDRAGLGATGQQQPHHAVRAFLRRKVERRVAADPGHGLHVGAGVEQQRRGVSLVTPCGPVQRGHAVALRRIHVHAPGQQRLQRRKVALHRGVGHLGANGGDRGRAARRRL